MALPFDSSLGTPQSCTVSPPPNKAGGTTLPIPPSHAGLSAGTEEVLALACFEPSGEFKTHSILRKIPGEDSFDVQIDILYCGICHSDIHQGRAEWGINIVYPMVPGHEMAGVVRAVGGKVTKFRPGDRVGVGCFVDSCRNCDSCQQGEEQYCTAAVPAPSEEFPESSFDLANWATYNSYVGEQRAAEKGLPDAILYGGYSQRIVVDEKYCVGGVVQQNNVGPTWWSWAAERRDGGTRGFVDLLMGGLQFMEDCFFFPFFFFFFSFFFFIYFFFRTEEDPGR